MTDDILDENQLRNLAARTAQLPREIAPPEEAWSAIRTAMESPAQAHAGKLVATAIWQRPAFLAAAALLLVAGSSAITAVAIGGRPGAQADSTVIAAHPAADAPATLAEFAALENDYIGTANRLSAMLESEQVELSPVTLERVKESLRVIDAAILEARRALAEDPGNPQLVEMLTATYGQKIDFLRRTTEMGRS